MKVSKLLILGMLVISLHMAVPAMAANIGNEKDVVPASPNIYYVGDTINYIITVTNLNATVDMRVDLVEDIFPDGSSASLDPTVPFVLGPGEFRTYTPSWPITATGSVVNTSRVVGAQLTTPLEDPFDSSVTKSSLVISPEITIVKTVDCDGDGEYLAVDVGGYGDNGAWRIVVTNTGDSPLTNVVTTDTNGQSFGPVDLAIGESVQYDYVTPGLTATTTNTATVVAEDLAGGTVGPVSSTATNEITISPDIDILKTVDCDGDGEYLPVDTGTYGDDGAWRIVVTNTGDSPLTNVVTTDTNGQSFGPVDLAIGESVQYDYVTPGLTATTTNTATVVAEDVFGGTVGPVSSTATNEITISPDIDILKTVDCDGDGEYLPIDTGTYGDDGAWRIVVTNTGDSPLSNVMTTDTNGQSFGPVDLAIGESVQYDYVTPGLTVTTTNTATVVAEDVFGGTVGPVSSTATNIIAIEPDIAIVKTVDCDGDGVYLPVDVGIYGDNGAWRIVVTNTGDSPLTNVVTTDTNGQSFGPVDLAIGESVQYDYVTPGLTATTTNTATVVAEDVFGGTVGPESSTAINEILYPDTTVSITASDELVCEGDEVTLTICEANTGQVDLTDVSVDVTYDDGGGEMPLTILTTPPDIGDNGNGILEPGEEWCWIVIVIVDTTTTYGATGHGLDPLGNDITPPAYPLEYDEVTVETEPCGDEGCTPGFWKNNGDKHGASAWCERFSPSDPISMHFSLIEPLVVRGKGRSTITNPTLLQALNANGGGVNAMIRHGIAAMLNACSDCVQYEYSSEDQVISMIEDTLNGAPGAYTVGELHSMFAEANEAGCPVNQHGDCVGVEDEIDG